MPDRTAPQAPPRLVPATDITLPRILCLHGGGVNARIFRMQCRALIKALGPYFRLVFADAPFFSAAGPGIHPVYTNYGPFRSWLRWLPEQAPAHHRDATTAIEMSMRAAMDADDAAGGQGEWIGLIGFSQGAQVAASVLYETQARKDEAGRLRDRGIYDEGIGFADGDWRFAILFAGRAPLVALSDLTYEQDTFDLPGELCQRPRLGEFSWNQCRLRMPTVHIHGLKDPGYGFHRALLQDFTEPGSASVVEWEGDHRVPIYRPDVDRVLQATLKAYQKSELELINAGSQMGFTP